MVGQSAPAMSVRIIAGRHRARVLQTPKDQRVRPTPGVVRERLFNWLMGQLEGAVVLDLFAGTGALGLEAWSRGARRVDFVEKDPGIRKLLAHNLQRCALSPKESIVGGDALDFLLTRGDSYDLVLADPPFGQDWSERLRPQLLGPESPVRIGGWLYLESSAQEMWSPELLPAGWSWYRQGHCGQSHYVLLHHGEHVA